MKKLLTVCLLAYASHALAQIKSTEVDSLIKNKTFKFVVTEVKQKYPMKASSNNLPIPESDNVNAALTTPAQRLEITSTPIAASGEYVREQYNKLERVDATYTTAFQESGKKKSVSANTNYAFYLIQEQDKIEVNSAKNPTAIYKIKTSDFYSISNSNYKLKSVKKNNGKWVLTYHIKDGDKSNIFYLDVNSDGSAVLTNGAATILNGFIVPSV